MKMLIVVLTLTLSGCANVVLDKNEWQCTKYANYVYVNSGVKLTECVLYERNLTYNGNVVQKGVDAGGLPK